MTLLQRNTMPCRTCDLPLRHTFSWVPDMLLGRNNPAAGMEEQKNM